MFDLDRFVDECRAALAADRGWGRAMREVVARAVSGPADLVRALSEPERAGLNVLHHAPDLTVLNLVWGPGMEVMPHNHHVAAAIGIYTGREDNAFRRRIGAGEDVRRGLEGEADAGAPIEVPAETLSASGRK